MTDAPGMAILAILGFGDPTLPTRSPGEKLRWVRDDMGRETWERIEEGEEVIEVDDPVSDADQ